MGREVGKEAAKHKLAIMTGGGPGVMEAANRGAKETPLGCSYGCAILIPEEQSSNKYMDTCRVFKNFFIRKVMLCRFSTGFIVLPGGFGTLDELFEMLTLIKTKRVKNFPIVLMGSEYWKPMLKYFDETMLQTGTVRQEEYKYIYVTDDPSDAVSHILKQEHVRVDV